MSKLLMFVSTAQDEYRTITPEIDDDNDESKTFLTQNSFIPESQEDDEGIINSLLSQCKKPANDKQPSPLASPKPIPETPPPKQKPKKKDIHKLLEIEEEDSEKRLTKDLTKQKLNHLTHSGLASHFKMIATAETSFPPYTRPVIALRDQKYFSPELKTELERFNRNYQRNVWKLLSLHHNNLANKADLMVKMRLDDVNRLYKDESIYEKIDKL